MKITVLTLGKIKTEETESWANKAVFTHMNVYCVDVLSVCMLDTFWTLFPYVNNVFEEFTPRSSQNSALQSPVSRHRPVPQALPARRPCKGFDLEVNTVSGRQLREADIFDRVKAGRTGLKWQRWKRVLRWVPVLWVVIIKGRKVSGVNSRSGCWKGVSPKGCGGDCSMPLSQHRAFAGNLCHSILGCVDAASQSLPSFSRGTLPVCLSVSKFHLFYKDDIILV